MPAPLFPGISDEDILAALRASGANLAPPPEQLAAEVAAAPPPQPSPFFPASQLAAPPPGQEIEFTPEQAAAVPVTAPQLPAPVQVPALGGVGPTDVAGAEGQRQDVLAAAAENRTRAIEGELGSQNAALGRQADVESTYAERQARLDADFQTRRAEARQAAAVETAGWMRSMDDLANTEPNHQRFWNNQDRFGKGLWLLGMAFSSAGLIGTQAAGQRRNPVLEMLREEIASDVQDQKDVLGRRRETLKAKGDLMLRDQESKLADLRDDHSMAYQRLESLKRGALLRAQQMDPTDVRARALLAGADWASQEQLKIADTKVRLTADAREGALSRANQMAISKMADDRARDIAVMEDQTKRDLAQQELTAKMAAAEGVGGKDLRQLPTSTGFLRRDPASGKMVPLTVNKDDYKEVAKKAQEWTDQGAALQKLRAAFSDAGTFEKLIQSDEALVSAIEEAAGPIAQQLNGGGRLTDTDVARGYGALLGYNPKGFVSMLKGGHRDDVLKLLDQRISSLPKRAANDVAIHAGVQLGPDELTFTPRSDLVTTESKPEPTRQQDLAKAGVVQSPLRHPATPDEYLKAKSEEAQTSNQVLPPLAPELKTKVDEFSLRVDHSTPAGIMQTHAAALRALDAYKSAQIKAGADPKVVDTEVSDARTRIAGEYQRALPRASERWDDAVGAVLSRVQFRDEVTKADVVEVAKQVGIGAPTPDELEGLIRAVREQIGDNPVYSRRIRNLK